jgi:hypothetical protein
MNGPRCDDRKNPSGAVFGDVGEPHLVDPCAVNWRSTRSSWTGSPAVLVRPGFLANTDRCAPGRAQPGNPILAGGDPASGKIIGDEALPECGVVRVNVAGRVDVVGIVSVAL